LLAAWLSTGVGAAVAPHAAFAGDRATEDACYAAATDAQRLRKDVRLVEARDKLLVCARTSCPSDAAKLCNQWLAEVTAAIPTLVVSAKDAAGRDVPDVRVMLDGKLLADKLDGMAIPVDPGTYRLRCEHSGSGAVEQQLVVHEGEKNRLVSITFGGAAAPTALASSAVEPERPPSRGGGSSALGWAVTGLGVASLGVFGYLAIAGQVRYDKWVGDQRPQGEASSLQAQRVAAFVTLGVGVIASAVGLWLVVRAHSADATKTTARSASLGIVPLAQGAELGLRGAF
jgi:hypothetical protein